MGILPLGISKLDIIKFRIYYFFTIPLGIAMSNMIDHTKNVKPIIDGFCTGCISTVLFNPIDRALFLMVKDKKPFYDPTLWRTPYQGVIKALYGRIIGYGVYLSFFDIYSDFFKKNTQQPLLLASVATGLSTVGLSHGFNVIKMYQWSHKTSDGMLTSVKLMTAAYGWRVFFRALPQTCARDCLFSTTYFMLSDKFNHEKKFERSIVIASGATALSAPLNYLRSRLFFDFQESRVPLIKIAEEIGSGMKLKKTFSRKLAYIMQTRFNIGLGTLRVGLGMAVADKIYHHLKATSYLCNAPYTVDQMGHQSSTGPIDSPNPAGKALQKN
jgi:hypothetical protein